MALAAEVLLGQQLVLAAATSTLACALLGQQEAVAGSVGAVVAVLLGQQLVFAVTISTFSCVLLGQHAAATGSVGVVTTALLAQQLLVVAVSVLVSLATLVFVTVCSVRPTNNPETIALLMAAIGRTMAITGPSNT